MFLHNKRDAAWDGIPRLALNGLFNGQRGLRFGRELEHDLTTAHGDTFLIECIECLLAFLADVDETGIAQDGEMMRDGGLSEADFFNDLIDREFATTTRAHDLLARIVGDGFGKQDGIEFHDENSLCARLYRRLSICQVIKDLRGFQSLGGLN